MTGLNTQSIHISGTLLGKIIRAGAMHFDDVEQVALEIVDLPCDAKIMEIQEVERDADMFVMHWCHPDLTGMGRGEAPFYTEPIAKEPEQESPLALNPDLSRWSWLK